MSKLHKRAIVLESGFNYSNWLSGIGFDILPKDTKIRKASLIVFTGGSDVSPSLYREESIPLNKSNYDTKRDSLETLVYNEALRLNIPMLGICRGAQFLCVMKYGALIQHVEGHNQGSHEVILNSGKRFNVTSTHHQMMHPIGGHVLAYADGISKVYKSPSNRKPKDWKEPEAVYWPSGRVLGVQWHPEQMSSESEGASIVKYWIERRLLCLQTSSGKK